MPEKLKGEILMSIVLCRGNNFFPFLSIAAFVAEDLVTSDRPAREEYCHLCNEDLMKTKTHCVLFYARLDEEEGSHGVGWKGGKSVTYRLGANCQTYLFRIALVSPCLQR